jgi:hypothetical protein
LFGENSPLMSELVFLELKCRWGVFDMNLQQIENDFVPIFNFEDAFLLDYVQN